MRRSRKQGVAEPLVDFWSELRDTRHPQDKAILDAYPNIVNTDHPPTPFVGDLRQARLFVLYANGGYDAERTHKDFANMGTADEYRARLRNPAPCEAGKTHPYFLEGRLGGWLQKGEAALVNAMAYRSSGITKEHRALADKLPSVRFHREWLRSHLLAAAGKIMVIVHRPGLWKLDRSDENEFVLFTNASRYRFLPNWVADRADAFLASIR